MNISIASSAWLRGPSSLSKRALTATLLAIPDAAATGTHPSASASPAAMAVFAAALTAAAALVDAAATADETPVDTVTDAS